MNCLLGALRRSIPLGTALLAVVCSLNASGAEADGRRLNWSPNRSATSGKSAIVAAVANDPQPDWQQNPQRSQRSNSAAPSSTSQRPAAKQPAVRQASHSGSSSSSTRSAAYQTWNGTDAYMARRQPEVIEGPMPEGYYESDIHFEHAPPGYGHGCESCGDVGCDSCCDDICGSCGGPCDAWAGCDSCREQCAMVVPCWPCGWLTRESHVFAGVHSFAGPVDQGRNGNFGFNEGINLVGPMIPFYQIGFQVGARFAQSNLSGDRTLGVLDREDSREQTFFTVGAFHRACNHLGFQWGVVYDSLDDNYYEDTQLSQVRTEMSWLFRCGHEVGFLGAFGTLDDNEDDDGQSETFEPTDQFIFFYRRTLANGGQGRIFFGGTDNNDGLFGADFRVPLSNRFEFQGGFNYLIPEEGSGTVGSQEESYGMALNVVWYAGRFRDGVHNTPYRALMDIADNRWFMVDRITP